MSDWISVKDRLPEVFDEVIVYFNGFISIAWRETEKRKNGIVGWHLDSQMSYPESLVNVTHWMPLPEPPNKTNKTPSRTPTPDRIRHLAEILKTEYSNRTVTIDNIIYMLRSFADVIEEDEPQKEEP